jgi:hypothetical protein
MKQLFRALLVLGSLLVSLILGCSLSTPTVAPIDTISFVPNDNVYVTFPNSGFPAHFVVRHDTALVLDQATVQSITFLPQPPGTFVELDSFRVSQIGTFDEETLHNVNVRFKARATGTHTFTEAVITTTDQTYTLPIGSVTVVSQPGQMAPIIVGFESGIYRQSAPNRFSVKNSNESDLIIKDVVLPHNRIRFTQQDIAAHTTDSTRPLPPEGLRLSPGERASFTLDWVVDLPPDELLNIDVRPLLLVEYQGQTMYGVMANMVFRHDPRPAQP